ncbi:MAG: hypothetical protein WD048_06930 [Chitinophagales bacterium]
MRQHIILFIVTLFCFPFAEVSAQDKPVVDLGGALRFNYNMSSWKSAQQKRGGDFGYDIFRINAEVKYKGVYLNAEYRLYSRAFGGGVLKQGWIGYPFKENHEIQLGLAQVPFGIQRYNSHNWFFSLAYYFGLEDDHDMGLKYIYKNEKIDFHFAYFKGAEELSFGNKSEHSFSRYSYDVVGRNKEANQLNGKFVYKLGDKVKNKLGISGQYGGLFNLDTEKYGNHYAFAGHYEMDYKSWNIKAQAIYCSHNPANADGELRDRVTMAAYGFPYEVAANFALYTLGVSKTIPVNWGSISSLQFYNDFSFMDKDKSDFEDSFMNVTGILVSAGNVYTYIDYAAGYNHSWLGGNFVDDFSVGNSDAKWEARFNINFGYYFLTDNKSR